MLRKRSPRAGVGDSSAREPESDFDRFMSEQGRKPPHRGIHLQTPTFGEFRRLYPSDEPLDAAWRRYESLIPDRLQQAAQAAEAAVQRNRELCRKALRPAIHFEDLDTLVNRLPPTRRERWGRDAVER